MSKIAFYKAPRTGDISLVVIDKAEALGWKRPPCEEVLADIEEKANRRQEAAEQLAADARNKPRPEWTEGMPKPQETQAKAGCGGCSKNLKEPSLMEAAKGLFGLAKAFFKIDPVPEEVMLQREKTCLSCKDYRFGVCQACGCFCAAKVTVAGEKCPKDLWGAYVK